MPKGLLSLLTVCLVLIMFSDTGYSQDKSTGPVRFMFYNVENLFDTKDDTLKADNEFLPGGTRNWNYSRYIRKINSLYKTILAAGSWNPPAIVGFCEIENRKVLEDLVQGTYLSRYNYRILHEDSPDQRGIDVCLIYRADSLNLLDYGYWIPGGISREEYTTRSVLHACFACRGDTFHIILNHWPSRRGGVLAGEDLRSKISAMILGKADSITVRYNGKAKIIIAGDFNCTPLDNEIQSLVKSRSSGCLNNLSRRQAERGGGTYRFQGSWEMIDQVIVSCAFISSRLGLYTGEELLTVFKPPFLLKKDPKYPGESPFPTYRGYKYEGGFSDHLPVLLDLRFRSADSQE